MIHDVQFDDFAFQQAQRPFARPSGGCEQAKAMSLASFSPSKIRGTGGVARCLRFNTASRPPCANCCRTRAHMIGYVPKASEICGSVHFGPNGLSSARKSIRALSCFLAGLLPLRISASSCLRCAQFDNIAPLAHLRLRRFESRQKRISHSIQFS